MAAPPTFAFNTDGTQPGLAFEPVAFDESSA